MKKKKSRLEKGEQERECFKSLEFLVPELIPNLTNVK